MFMFIKKLFLLKKQCKKIRNCLLFFCFFFFLVRKFYSKINNVFKSFRKYSHKICAVTLYLYIFLLFTFILLIFSELRNKNKNNSRFDKQ
jgi:hypothetical protein